MNKKIKMKKLSLKIAGLMLLFTFLSCSQATNQKEDDVLFSGFVNPPTEARPFVRWWWNGNQIDTSEISRELDVLQKAGIGGVEINPIAMPDEAKDIGAKPLTWLSREWNQTLKFAALEAQRRGMIADLIVGSGWPFGGEFLKEDETIQRIVIKKIACPGGQRLEDNLEGLYQKAQPEQLRGHSPVRSYELVFIRLVPAGIRSVSETIDLTSDFKKNQRMDFEVPPGKFELVYGILLRGNREVMHGAPGAAGPVMNHYERKITRAYLNRLNKISEDTGVSLSDLIRALFCDSIELDGANWTDGFADIFFNTYNYRLEPWFPFVLYNPEGYPKENFEAGFYDKIKRVRYDYNKLLIETFLKNFTREFQDFCTEKGVLCRYQAYGTPFLMGMTEGNMIPDIPESNNWIYSSDMEADEWSWNQQHGYMIWNLYAASGGHLTGKKVISCEAMTNTRGVFKTSLEEIKQHDDMNFITGINHSVLHGFNYSPPEAGFPGWVRYGTYFSEQNTWWPYFPQWAEYNARLSYLFQQSKPVKKLAVLTPEGDIWSDYGLARGPFHTQPWYCHRLWEPFSQVGSSCDYIGRKIIREGSKREGKLTFGPMSYEAILLCGIQSLDPETAQALLEFVQNGGRIAAVDSIPDRSLAFQHAAGNDSIVQSVFAHIQKKYADRFVVVKSPTSEAGLLFWVENVLNSLRVDKDVDIDTPDKNVFQIHQKAGKKDIYFFTNSNKSKTVTFNAVFPTGSKTPWVWNPEDGTRHVFPFGEKRNELTIELDPLQSLLVVFDPNRKGTPGPEIKSAAGDTMMTIEGPWELTFEHVNGQKFNRRFEQLAEFGIPDDPQINTFAGTVTYSTTFKTEKKAQWLRLGKVNKGITEVFLNGQKVGLNWYEKPVFNIHDALKIGENHLKIKYTTVLSNYMMSLKDNTTAQKWTTGYEKIPIGLEGEVVILLPYLLN